MWFGASVLFRAEHLLKQISPALCEESVILIEAGSLEQATERAIAIGQDRQHGYPVLDGDRVEWIFDSVLGVAEIEAASIETGVEVFSRFLNADKAEMLRQPID